MYGIIVVVDLSKRGRFTRYTQCLYHFGDEAYRKYTQKANTIHVVLFVSCVTGIKRCKLKQINQNSKH